MPLNQAVLSALRSRERLKLRDLAFSVIQRQRFSPRILLFENFRHCRSTRLWNVKKNEGFVSCGHSVQAINRSKTIGRLVGKRRAFMREPPTMEIKTAQVNHRLQKFLRAAVSQFIRIS